MSDAAEERLPADNGAGESTDIPHNLDLYRIERFTGMRRELLALHGWLTGGDDQPAIAISGEQGLGKSALATAAAWNHLRTFTDGVLRVSPAGAAPFRLYDVARGMDVVFGTTMTRASSDRWGISMLEQLYRRRRLVILDKLAGATESEIRTLVDIIGHLHESGGHSRILLIDRNFQPGIADLVQARHVRLRGIDAADVPDFIRRRCPADLQPRLLPRAEELHALTGGAPLAMRLVMGLLRDFSWQELALVLRDFGPEGDENESIEGVDIHKIAALAIESLANTSAAVGPLLDRMVTARGGASDQALEDLFWGDMGSAAARERTMTELTERGIIERDSWRRRYVLHPVIRRYLEQNAAMLGEQWERRHAIYYLGTVQSYLSLPLERWNEVDVEWGNVFKGADWCQQRVERIWQRRAVELVANPAHDNETLAIPSEVQADAAEIKEDLRLVRDYGLALAHYAFWRHPPGSLAWLASGGVAAAALADQRDYGWFLMNIGRQHFFTGDVARALPWFERARALFDPRDLLAELAYVYTDLGTSLRILDQSRKSLDYFNAAFDCVAQLGDQQGLATASMNLGSAYYSVNNYDRALVEHRRALRIGLRRSDHSLAGSALNNMGLALEAIERLDDAQKAYETALLEFETARDTVGISAAYNNLGSATYARQAYEQALRWYEKDLALLEERGAWTDMAATLHNLGHVALEMQDTPRALDYFTQSRDLYAAFDLADYVAEEQEMIESLTAAVEEPAEEPGFFRRTFRRS
jgi:tetratricopeptide (TPR) repeat protein